MNEPRVLVVDDSLTVRIDLVEGLASAGFDAVGCGSLADARAALGGEAFDLVILDRRLPDGDGVELLAELRGAEHASRKLPVMMLSSEAEVRDRVRARQIGADDYAAKPYDLLYVVSRARELVSAAITGDGAQRGRARSTVLIVDDSLTFREGMREALEAAGYRAVAVASGEEGLRLAASLLPALMIVDAHLPGIDGATVIRRLRLDAVLRHTACIMITASDTRDSEIRAFEAGVDGYVSKRTPPAEIVARVAALAASRSVPPTPIRSALGANKVLVVGKEAAHLANALLGESLDIAHATTPDEAAVLLGVEPADCVLVTVTATAAPCKVITSALSRPTAVLAVTATEDSDLAIDCLSLGADDVVPRSTPRPLFLARVRAQLRRKQAEEESAHERDARLSRELSIAEAEAQRVLADTRAALLADVERKNAELAEANRELETFSYTVSHDLRAPLRVIEGFALALEEDQGHLLESEGRAHLRRILEASKRMNALIDDLLTLSRLTLSAMQRERVDLSALARIVCRDLAAREPSRSAEVTIQDGLIAEGDASLLCAVLENLLGNAWKFSGKREHARIAVGGVAENGTSTFFVRDNGVGFDQALVDRLFRPFQRLHAWSEFEGTGIGLATVRRILGRHGGRVWAEGTPEGACFYFTLPGGS